MVKSHMGIWVFEKEQKKYMCNLTMNCNNKGYKNGIMYILIT